MSASKRDELVQQALKAFYAGGFHAVGMDRLAKETGVSKTAIYKHFRTKEDLILAALRLRDEQFRNWFVRRVEALAETPRERLVAIFDAMTEWLASPQFQSCMFIKAASEYQDRAHPVHSVSAEHKRLVLQYIEELAVKAQARNPKNLAAELFVLTEGEIVWAHFGAPDEAAQSAKRAAETLIAIACDTPDATQ